MAGAVICRSAEILGNFRLAHALPAQNFECLAHGLTEMFRRIGRVPVRIRCDNMSTAVAKIIRRDELGKGLCNHDETDHPRRLTDNFYGLKMAWPTVSRLSSAIRPRAMKRGRWRTQSAGYEGTSSARCDRSTATTTPSMKRSQAFACVRPTSHIIGIRLRPSGPCWMRIWLQ